MTDSALGSNAAQKFSPHHSLTTPWERGERRAGLDSQVGCIISFEEFSNIASSTWNYCKVIAFGQWLIALEFLIYKLNECSISFTRERDWRWSLISFLVFEFWCNTFLNLCLYEPNTESVEWNRSICGCIHCKHVFRELLLINLWKVAYKICKWTFDWFFFLQNMS